MGEFGAADCNRRERSKRGIYGVAARSVARYLHSYGAGMIPIEDARKFVFDNVPALTPVRLTLWQSLGCVLAEDVTAAEDVPPFENTAVDGYAVRAADTASATADAPVELDVVDEIPAGKAPSIPVGPGQAIRIMTGAPTPPGADAIVMVEDTERLDDGARVRVLRSVNVGDAYRPAGDDIRAGELVFRAGTEIRPGVLGVLASVNRREVLVVPCARVAVLSTGDELIDDGTPLAPGQIRESNRTMLVGAVTQAGCVAVDYGVVRDDEAALEAVLRTAASECDAIVTSGGVSMGDYDVVKAVLSQIAEMTWMQIAIKPAKPFAFGLLDGTPVFGLPGNPVSSLVSFELLARPALRRMMGQPTPDRVRVLAVADDGLKRRPDGKVHYQRVYGSFGADGRYHVKTTGPQGSHQLAATAAANALAEIHEGDGIAPGGDVEVLILADS
jgi:molybdopterin molybdotransferase